MSIKEDPFFLVQNEVQQSFQQIQVLFASWLRILKSVKSLHNEEYINVTLELQSNLHDIHTYLDDLQEAIDMAKSNRDKFQIDNNELLKRQNYVHDTKKKLKEIEDALEDPESILKGIKKQAKNGTHIIEMEPLSSSYEQDNEVNGVQLSAQNTMIIEQQDQQLDQILGTVKNLKQIAETVNDELDLHAEMLDEIDTRMDSTQDKLNSAYKKVKKIGEKLGGVKSSFIIILLVFILSILAFVLFFS